MDGEGWWSEWTEKDAGAKPRVTQPSTAQHSTAQHSTAAAQQQRSSSSAATDARKHARTHARTHADPTSLLSCDIFACAAAFSFVASWVLSNVTNLVGWEWSDDHRNKMCDFLLLSALAKEPFYNNASNHQ
jgi:hypothetical protein